MSMKDRLAKKTEGLLVPEKKVDKGAAPPLRTSPGQMLMVNALTKENNQRIAQLEERLKEFEGALPVKLIEAERVLPSKWANRIEESFGSSEFASLKEEILQAGGNVQPIKVRPLAGSDERYEIVYGHRRHRACLELGLPVLAFVDEVDDQELFAAMDRENRQRLNLSAWEQGRMYRQALQEGLFGSISELARQVGVDKGNLSKALALADLPDEVVRAFGSPLDLQFRWAKLLNDVMQRDPDGVIERARSMAGGEKVGKSAKEILNALLAVEESAEEVRPILRNGKAIGRLVSGEKGLRIEIGRPLADADALSELKELMEGFVLRRM